MWTHQLARPAGEDSSRRHPSRNVTINVAMSSPIAIDSIDTLSPSPAGRMTARRIKR